MKMRESTHYKWKGDEASYGAKHQSARRHYRKEACENCGSKRHLEMANISGEYSRDPSDWKTLCASCHHKLDDLVAKQRASYPVGKCGYRGVVAVEGGYMSRLHTDGYNVYLGYSRDIEDAAMLRLAAEEQLLSKEKKV